MAAHCSGCVFMVCVCSLLCVCNFDGLHLHLHFKCSWVKWVKCRARIPSMGHHTWPYVMSLSLSLSIPMTEVPLSKALNPQLLPGCRSKNGYPLLQVCVHGVCVCVCVCVSSPLTFCVHLDGLNAEHIF